MITVFSILFFLLYSHAGDPPSPNSQSIEILKYKSLPDESLQSIFWSLHIDSNISPDILPPDTIVAIPTSIIKNWCNIAFSAHDFITLNKKYYTMDEYKASSIAKECESQPDLKSIRQSILNSSPLKNFSNDQSFMQIKQDDADRNNRLLKKNLNLNNTTEGKFNVGVTISPFRVTKAAKQRDVTYGSKLSYKFERYESFLEYVATDFRQVDLINNFKIEFARYDGTFNFDINKIWGNFSYFFMFNYQRARAGKVFIVRNNFQIGPVGLKYDFIENDPLLNELSASIIPLYEMRTENVQIPISQTNGVRVFKRISARIVRLSLRNKIELNLVPNILKMKNTMFLRPGYNLEASVWDKNDYAITNKTEFKLKLVDFINFNYVNEFIYERRNKIRNLPITDIIHFFQLELVKDF